MCSMCVFFFCMYLFGFAIVDYSYTCTFRFHHINIHTVVCVTLLWYVCVQSSSSYVVINMLL